MRIGRVSPFTGKEHVLEIPCTREQLEAWQAGTLIQHAMPNIPAELREFIMTGITPDEWNAAFPEEADAE